MITVIKRHGKPVQAYLLGEDSPVLDRLIRSGKIIPLPDGNYEVMSREAVHGNSGDHMVPASSSVRESMLRPRPISSYLSA